MAVCREVATDPVEVLLPVKSSSAAFSPCPVLVHPSIFFMQSVGDVPGSNLGRSYLTLARSTDAFLSRAMRGHAQGVGLPGQFLSSSPIAYSMTLSRVPDMSRYPHNWTVQSGQD